MLEAWKKFIKYFSVAGLGQKFVSDFFMSKMSIFCKKLFCSQSNDFKKEKKSLKPDFVIYCDFSFFKNEMIKRDRGEIFMTLIHFRINLNFWDYWNRPPSHRHLWSK